MLYDFQKKIVLYFLFAFYFGISQTEKIDITYFTGKDTLLSRVFSNAPRFGLQVFLSYQKKGKWHHEFFGDSMQYFYPASLVKLPTALAAVRWLKENQFDFEMWDSIYLCRKQTGISKNEKMNDTISIKDHIIRSLVVSDNESFNLLYELTGYYRVQKILEDLGMKHSRIVHHFGTYNKKNDSLIFPEVELIQSGKVIKTVRVAHALSEYGALENALVGTFKKKNCKEKDFSRSNMLPLTDIHRMLMRLLEENLIPVLGQKEMAFLKQCLWAQPHQIKFKGYDSLKHYPSLKKYFIYGSDKKSKPDEKIDIWNIVGQSYGFLADVAYIYDKKRNLGCYLSAVIYVNDKDCFGKGWYEYEQTGFPFLKRLGLLTIEYVSDMTK
ncbi:MAG: class A beta-lactamase-related serine hydrolase [Bacteroidia bacterium]|nr:class A beta-lactamase-related serine hydrolase [Bacteroidia bacterium]